MQIAGYEVVTPFETTGSGYARWCEAIKDGQRYFIKQFLAPVQPVQTTEIPTELVIKKRQRCVEFEKRKRTLYDALQRIPGECMVRVNDFFVYDGHYFAVSEYIDPAYPTFATIDTLHKKAKLRLLLSLAECLQALHNGGVVHADLKPDHIIIDNRVGKMVIRLIDFDSGFMEAAPPDGNSNIEVDPVYLAPETYRLMTAAKVRLTHKLDTFSFGILLHQAFSGELPQFDRTKYSYLYACILDKGSIVFSDKLTKKQQALIRRMLQKNPAKRPGDQTICEYLKSELS